MTARRALEKSSPHLTLKNNIGPGAYNKLLHVMEIFVLLATLATCAVVGELALGLPHLAADPGGPGLFPLIVASVTGVACVLRLGQTLFLEPRLVTRDHAGAARGLLVSARTNSHQLGVVVLVMIFPLAIDWIGFVAAVLLFCFTVLLVSGKRPIVAAFASTLITAAVYFAYALVLRAVLPEGQLIYQLFY